MDATAGYLDVPSDSDEKEIGTMLHGKKRPFVYFPLTFIPGLP
jgi:hypothetical protein